ncbi:sensor histidine kinase [Spirillospora sp. NPDC048911]|uniref:sensor histidine kinase n=1 Tax=Spirillospora sp. NPDC048911 TaxID=3364527 RepID=UPI0037176776
MSSDDTLSAGPRGGRARAISLAVAGVLVALVVNALTWGDAPYGMSAWLLVELPGVSFTVCGLVLSLRRRGNGIGPRMAVVGCVWYAGTLQASHDPIVFRLGYVLFFVPLVTFVHMVLALPDGRLARDERVNVAAQYVTAVGLQVIQLLYAGSPQPEMWGDNPQPVSAWGRLGNTMMILFAVVSIAQVVRKWRRAGRPGRREYALVWASVLGVGLVIAASAALYLIGVGWLDRQRLGLAFILSVLVLPVAVAAGLLRTRLARLEVADLVVRLDKAVEPAEVRSAIARALGDPGLDLRFPLPDGTGYVGVDGRPAPLPADAGRARTAVARQGRVLAVLLHDPELHRQRTLVDSVVAAAGLSLDNARLYAAQHAQLEQIRDSRARVVVAADAERARIQRDLHDGVQHKLLTIALCFGQARDHLADAGHSTARDLETISGMMREVIRDLRDVAEDICPPALTEQGLAVAMETVAERAPLPVVADVPVRRWPGHVERAAYFVIAEALANVYKHARAGKATVHVADEPRRLIVTVSDDGVGGAEPGKGTGLRGLQDRVSALGGSLSVGDAPGSGTRLIAVLPI